MTGKFQRNFKSHHVEKAAERSIAGTTREQTVQGCRDKPNKTVQIY